MLSSTAQVHKNPSASFRENVRYPSFLIQRCSKIKRVKSFSRPCTGMHQTSIFLWQTLQLQKYISNLLWKSISLHISSYTPHQALLLQNLISNVMEKVCPRLRGDHAFDAYETSLHYPRLISNDHTSLTLVKEWNRTPLICFSSILYLKVLGYENESWNFQ